jgi:sarcosine oxidase subunit beta
MSSKIVKHADVIIIGAGVIGLSIAYHLSCNGIKKIMVLESASSPGLGSTSKATGGYRAQFGSGINIQLSLLARKKLLEFKDEHGIDPGYIQAGYLFLAQNNEEMKNLTLANALQQRYGLMNAVLVSNDDIKRLNPHINIHDIIGGFFCQSDGFIDPMNILNGYLSSSQKNGVEIIYNTGVSGIKCADSNIEYIETSSGSYSADKYVNAAGAWAGAVADLAGESLPVKHLKRQVCRIKEKNILPADTPMTIWVNNSFHFRMRDGHLILLLPSEPDNNDNYNAEVEPDWLNKVFRIAKEKIPLLNDLSIDTKGSWAGLYEMSPDEHLILGRSYNLGNFYYANGSSGHGVMHSPAIGELLANIICNKPNGIDTEILSPERFTHDKLIEQIHFF